MRYGAFPIPIAPLPSLSSAISLQYLDKKLGSFSVANTMMGDDSFWPGITPPPQLTRPLLSMLLSVQDSTPNKLTSPSLLTIPIAITNKHPDARLPLSTLSAYPTRTPIITTHHHHPSQSPLPSHLCTHLFPQQGPLSHCTALHQLLPSLTPSVSFGVGTRTLRM